MIQCANCGNMNEPGAVFCDQCGTALAGSGGNVSGSAPGAGQPAPNAALASQSAASVCPSCGHAVIPGEAFCDNCGAALSGAVSGGAVSGGAASGGAVGSAGTPPPPAVAPSAPAPAVQQYTAPPVAAPQPSYVPPAAPASGRLEASDGHSYTLSGKSVYLIGREDSVSGIFPDVDTTPSGGDQAGVSRRHAEIHQQGTQWFITDLGSTNGTFVNNQRLAPNQRTPIAPGTQIRLGKWAATFQV